MFQKSTKRGGMVYSLIVLAFLCSGTSTVSSAYSSSRVARPSNAHGIVYGNPSSRQIDFDILPAIADLDGDHFPDVASGGLVESTFGIKVDLSSHQQEIFLPTRVPPPGAVLMAYDIDHDQDLDLVIASPAFLRPITVWLGDGRGDFEEPISYPTVSLLNCSETSIAIRYAVGKVPDDLVNDGNPSHDYSSNHVADFRLKEIGNVVGHTFMQHSQNSGRGFPSRSPPLDFLV